MPKLKAKELRKLPSEETEKRVLELRSELSRLRSGAERGVLKKETGKIRVLRRNIARLLTVLAEGR